VLTFSPDLLAGADLYLLSLFGVFVCPANPWALSRLRVLVFSHRPHADLHRTHALHPSDLDPCREGGPSPQPSSHPPQVLNFLLHVNSRANEFAADAYANELGMGEGLCSGLIKISVGKIGPPSTFLSPRHRELGKHGSGLALLSVPLQPPSTRRETPRHPNCKQEIKVGTCSFCRAVNFPSN
jgi:hypothetical protein